MDLTGKVAIVTGSGRGIGKAIALKLAAQGASVAVNDIADAENLESVAAEIRSLGRDSLAVIANISSEEDAVRMIDTTVEKLGRVDILVNNAGITRDQLLMRMSGEDWDAVIQVNLRSVFLCSRAVLRPMLKQRWGRIISMASIVGITGNAGQTNYAASKAGIIGFTRSLAKEVASRSITVNAIAPGFIETPMTAKLPEAQREELKKRIPAGYFGTPEDVAGVAAFLASEEARYLTGQVLVLDGGMGGV